MSPPKLMQFIYGAAVGAAIMTGILMAALGIVYVTQIVLDKWPK